MAQVTGSDLRRIMVEEGDTLSEIACRVGVPLENIVQLNAELLNGNPDLIFPGDILRLSAAASWTPSHFRR